MRRREKREVSNVSYRFDGNTVYGALPDGTVFLFDRIDLPVVESMKWYACMCPYNGSLYITNRGGKVLYRMLANCPSNMEIDHINLNTLDNRRCNLRACTHQQNQINQPLQKNNTSGVSGVSYYPPRKKYRARIKVSQHDIHLGYYSSFEEAVQARNVGMELMFGEYGRYNDVSPAPEWMRVKVYEQCKRFADLSVCGAYFNGEEAC
jgi:hypothetical protein